GGETAPNKDPRRSLSVRVFWHHVSPSNWSLGLHLYSRYDPLSKFSLVPRANPSTAYCVDAAVAFADKVMEARNAIAVLIAAAPNPGRHRDCLQPWLAKLRPPRQGQRIRQNPASPIPNRQTSIELPRIATCQSRLKRFTR